MQFLINKAILWVAAALIGLQALVIYADMALPTGPFDEIASFLINLALAYLVAQQRKIIRKVN